MSSEFVDSWAIKLWTDWRALVRLEELVPQVWKPAAAEKLVAPGSDFLPLKARSSPYGQKVAPNYDLGATWRGRTRFPFTSRLRGAFFSAESNPDVATRLGEPPILLIALLPAKPLQLPQAVARARPSAPQSAVSQRRCRSLPCL